MNQQNLCDPFSVRFPNDVIADIEVIARICGRSRGWVMVRALRTYLATEGSEIREIAASHERERSDNFVNLDDILTQLDRICEGKPA